MGSYRNRKNHPLLIFFLVLCVLIITISCGLAGSGMSQQEAELNPEDATQNANHAIAAMIAATLAAKPPVAKPTDINQYLFPNSAQEYAFQTGTHCIDAPGSDPCPADLCIAPPESYSFSMDISSELYGKKNPNDYSCSADFRLTNNSGVDLKVIYRVTGTEQTTWVNRRLPVDDLINERVINFYTRKDGKVMQQALPELLVVYDNPHCAWITGDNPKIGEYIVDVMNPCDGK